MCAFLTAVEGRFCFREGDVAQLARAVLEWWPAAPPCPLDGSTHRQQWTRHFNSGESLNRSGRKIAPIFIKQSRVANLARALTPMLPVQRVVLLRIGEE